jgi:uroporphyrinogen III methyltransferase/synthase
VADAAASSSPKSSLASKRIVITRAVAQSSELLEKLAQHRAIPVSLPLVSFSPPREHAALDAALRSWREFDWVLFTSTNAVQSVVARAAALGIKLGRIDNRPSIAAVGPATKEEAAKAGLVVDHVAQTHLGVALAEELASQLRDKSVLLPRSDRANPDLPAALKKLGTKLTEVIAYRTLPPSDADRGRVTKVLSAEADAAIFFSPSAVHNLAELIGKQALAELQSRIALAAVGPVTSAALREYGIQRIVMAVDTTTNAVIDALESYFTGQAGAVATRQPTAGARHG